jgi:toxin-antitoxin system PIN domain toxin
MAKDERALLDANVLVYAADLDSPEHERSRRLRDRAMRGELAAVLTPQVLFEFLAVVTNPSAVSNPLRPEEANEQVRILAEAIPLVFPTPETHRTALGLLGKTRISGRRVFDVVLAATLADNGISRVYTYDAGFGKIPGIEASAP